MPYRIRADHQPVEYEQLVHGLMASWRNHNRVWTPQSVRAALEEIGVTLDLPTIQAVLSYMVAQGHLELVP